MNRLAYVIVFTRQFEATQKFYTSGLGLEIRQSFDGWTEFDTIGAHLAVHEMADDDRQGVMLRFESGHLVHDMATLLGRGVRFDGDIIESGAGRLVNLWDPEDNLISLLEPAEPIANGLGPAIGSVILNCEDFSETVAFYKERLGLEVLREAQHWVEFDTGLTRLALHARPADQEHPAHAQQPIAWTIETDDLDDAVEGVRHRGFHLLGAVSSADFGRYAELRDPDARIVVLREPPSDEKVEELLAAAFEDDKTPSRAGIRKPLSKPSRAVSGAAPKPARRPTKRAAKHSAPASPKARAAKAAPKAKAAPRHPKPKPKTKPAIGRFRAGKLYASGAVPFGN